jgi:threonine aldolase
MANNLSLHLDGARVFNAMVANNETPATYGELFDTLSVCLSKGLGAPVGSVLLGKAAFIKKARRVRKVLGGGMRQAGYLAAAGLYALQNNIARLATDHAHAQAIATALQQKDFTQALLPVETNIVIAQIGGRFTAAELAAQLRNNNIYLLAIDAQHIRLVVHLDITPNMVQQTIQAIEQL